ncbi:Mur ligase family protein [Yinghuangia aomiensis]
MAAPDIAVVLNVGQAHLGVFGSRAAIARTKESWCGGWQPRRGRPQRRRSARRRDAYAHGRPDADVRLGLWDADVRVHDLSLDRCGRPSFTLRTAGASVPVRLPIVGAHQALNAAAAVAAGLVRPAYPSTRQPRRVGGCVGVQVAHGTASAVRRCGAAQRLLQRQPRLDPRRLDALAAVEGRRRIAVLGEMLELARQATRSTSPSGSTPRRVPTRWSAVGAAARPIAKGARRTGAVPLDDDDTAVGWLRGHPPPGTWC